MKRGTRDRELRYLRGMERLVEVVQELSLARNLETVVAIVRHAARELTGADGATFILREDEQCHYVDEEAIAPLWKGQRFPLAACISGWSMLNRQPAVIEDIYADPRVPHDAYRPTFVKSLAMVPIRTLDPIGAIGNYWAYPHLPTGLEVKLLQALADTTAVALENVRVYGELEQRVRDRTAELEEANRELNAFSYAVSHDLRAPVRHIAGFADLLLENSKDGLDDDGLEYLDSIRRSAGRMHQLIDDLLELSRTMQSPVKRERVDLSRLAHEFADQLRAAFVSRQVEFVIEDGLAVEGDAGLLRIALENLFSNAWKFTSRKDAARIEFGADRRSQDGLAYYVRDNGAGFDMRHAGRLFNVFQRLHANDDFPGTGVGLATVQRIVRKHGGRIWAEAALNQGAAFFFTLDGARPAGAARVPSIWTG
jgi:signal transduction histidine kinase